MITPYSQYVVTQAAINVATGERYKYVIDDMIVFAKGAYGEDSGYTWMDQNLRDRLLGMRRGSKPKLRMDLFIRPPRIPNSRAPSPAMAVSSNRALPPAPS